MNDPANTLKAHIVSNLQRLSRRIENVETQLVDERRYLEKLVEQLRLLKISEAIPVGQIAAAPKTELRPYVDRRSLPNPEKNLKISARRSFAWSYGKNAEQAHARAMSAVERRVRALGLKGVPQSVIDYVDTIAKRRSQR
jgi:hypothetical protein